MSKDTIAALCLIMACGGLMLASLDIREPDYGVLSPAAWPRLIIVIMGVLSVIFFLQSAFGNGQNRDAAIAAVKDAQSRPKGIVEFLQYWRNVFAVFITFGLFLLILDRHPSSKYRLVKAGHTMKRKEDPLLYPDTMRRNRADTWQGSSVWCQY